MNKVKVYRDDYDLIAEELEKNPAEGNVSNKPASALTVITANNTRPRASKKVAARKSGDRRRRVKNPAPGGGKPELTPEQALAQAWEYTYSHRGGFQQ